jgi:hypothetical protein
MIKKYKKFSIDKKLKKELEKLIENINIRNIYDDLPKGSLSLHRLNQVFPKELYEGIDYEIKYPGGMIIFSTELNSTIENKDKFFQNIKSFFEKKLKSFVNDLNVVKRVKQILFDIFNLIGYTFGKNFNGMYKSKDGKIYNEKSYTITITDVSSIMLKYIAEKICKEFKQETVMLNDFNENKVYFIDKY